MTKTELEAYFDRKFGHLSEHDKHMAMWNEGARNLCDLGDLCAKAKKTPLTPEELERLEECAGFEEACDNRLAADEATAVVRSQRSNNDGRDGTPRSVREFEAFLRDYGFSNRDARRIASEGFEQR